MPGLRSGTMIKKLIAIFILISNISFGQNLPKPTQNYYSTLPGSFNSFISSPKITWASQLETEYSFDNKDIKGSGNIYDYLMKSKLTGKIKSYVCTGPNHLIQDEVEYVNNHDKIDFFKELNKDSIPDYFALTNDSSKGVFFHEIFYLEDHFLKTKILAAAPAYKVFTSNGTYLGKSSTAYCAINLFSEVKKSKKGQVISLGNTYRVFNLDTLNYYFNIKKTYGMNLSFALWHDLSRNNNELTDLKTGKVIKSSDVIGYTILDSVEAGGIIETNPPTNMKIPGDPVLTQLRNIGIIQNWFYNVTKNIFFAEIPEVYLYVEYPDQDNVMIKEKRFKLKFK